MKLAIYLGEKFKLVLCRHCLPNRVVYFGTDVADYHMNVQV